jgi:hypothetical protein
MREGIPMTGFSRATEGGVVIWRADPCQSAHDFLLSKLQIHAPAFIGPDGIPTNQQRGNLGEFITFWVGVEEAHTRLQVFKPANAFQPLSTISRPGVDLLWIHFAEFNEHDFVLLQEVKTTGSNTLTYARTLLDDYEKLFGADPNLTLHTRLLEAKSELEYVIGRPELVPRVTRLAGTTPRTTPKARLVPTLVHDSEGSEPATTLLAVKSTIVALGWDATQVQPWSLALDQLNDRLNRLARGHR